MSSWHNALLRPHLLIQLSWRSGFPHVKAERPQTLRTIWGILKQHTIQWDLILSFFKIWLLFFVHKEIKSPGKCPEQGGQGNTFANVWLFKSLWSWSVQMQHQVRSLQRHWPMRKHIGPGKRSCGVPDQTHLTHTDPGLPRIPSISL